MAREPGFDPMVFMGAVVVEHATDGQVRRHVRLERLQKRQNLLMPMTPFAWCKDLAGVDNRRGEQVVVPCRV